MACSQDLFPELLRSRILRGDSSSLSDVDQFLRSLRIEDEGRQHVLLWLDRAMRDDCRISRLREIADLGLYLQRIARRHAWTRRRRDLLRRLREAAFARWRGPVVTPRGLNNAELAEITALVLSHVGGDSPLGASAFVGIAFGDQSYEGLAESLESRFGRVPPARLRARVSHVRRKLRRSLGWYFELTPADFSSDRGSES